MEVCLLLLSGWMKTMECWLSFVRVLNVRVPRMVADLRVEIVCVRFE